MARSVWWFVRGNSPRPAGKPKAQRCLSVSSPPAAAARRLRSAPSRLPPAGGGCRLCSRASLSSEIPVQTLKHCQLPKCIILRLSLEEVGPQRVVPDVCVQVQWWISCVAEVQTSWNMLQTIYESESCFSSDGVSGREQLLAQQRMHSMISSGKRQLRALDLDRLTGDIQPSMTRKHPFLLRSDFIFVGFI